MMKVLMFGKIANPSDLCETAFVLNFSTIFPKNKIKFVFFIKKINFQIYSSLQSFGILFEKNGQILTQKMQNLAIDQYNLIYC